MFIVPNDSSPFSLFGKKRAKRSRHRGGADREAYRSFLCGPSFFPRLRAALPYVPLPALVERMVVNEFSEIRKLYQQYALICRPKNRSQPHPRRGPGRGLGEGGSKSGRKCRFTCTVTKDFAVSTSPSRFLWLLSCAETRK